MLVVHGAKDDAALWGNISDGFGFIYRRVARIVRGQSGDVRPVCNDSSEEDDWYAVGGCVGADGQASVGRWRGDVIPHANE